MRAYCAGPRPLPHRRPRDLVHVGAAGLEGQRTGFWLSLPPPVRDKGVLVLTFADMLRQDQDAMRVLARLQGEAGLHFQKIVVPAQLPELLAIAGSERTGRSARGAGVRIGAVACFGVREGAWRVIQLRKIYALCRAPWTPRPEMDNGDGGESGVLLVGARHRGPTGWRPEEREIRPVLASHDFFTSLVALSGAPTPVRYQKAAAQLSATSSFPAADRTAFLHTPSRARFRV